MLSLCKTTTGVFRICADPGRSIFCISGKHFPNIQKERPLNLSHKSSLYLKQTHKDYAQNQTTEKTDNISKNHLSISPFTACLPDVII